MMKLKKIPVRRIFFFILGLVSFWGGLILAGYFLTNNLTMAQNKDQAANQANDVAKDSSKNGKTPSKEESGASSNLSPGSEIGEEALNLNEINTADATIVFQANVDYKYDPMGKRDLFRPHRNSKVGVGQLMARNRNLEPLENYDVKALQVVAIIWGNSQPRALVLDPANRVHSIKKGQRIGKNEGYVAEIREGELVVIEMFDLNGKVIKEPVVLTMKK